MTKFLTGYNLDNEIESIIREAKTKLLLISPYINLSDNIKNLLLQKISHPELEIIVAFREEWKEGKGKMLNNDNVEEVSEYKNLKELDIWKSFPNIRLVGLTNLHAKYYANEDKGVITSLNLYKYSIKNNIEYGSLIRGNTFLEATNYSERIIEDWGNVIYVKVPRYRVIRGEKKYVDSVELFDSIYKKDSLVHVDKSKLSTREIVLKSVEIGQTTVENGKRKYSVEEKRRKYENAYMPWDKQSDDELIKFVVEGKSISELATIYKRTQDAIRSRIRKLSKESNFSIEELILEYSKAFRQKTD